MRSILSILAPTDVQGVQVDSPAALAETARDLNAQMSGFGRTLLLLILGAGGFFVAAVVLADVLIRRRDLGRRRTLGVTRADLIALVSLRTLITALLGAALGNLLRGLPLGPSGKFSLAFFTDFRAVLPQQPKLEQSILSPKKLHRCEVCGMGILARSGRAKYCPACAKEVHRQQKAKSSRKWRSGVDNLGAKSP